MTRLACIALQVALAVAALAAAPRPAAADPCTYAIVVSAATRSAPEWAAVVEALAEKHRGRGVDVIEWKESVDEAVAPLAASMPRHACFVAKPEEAGREFVAAVHRLTRRLDDDPYADVLWGILTGFDAANALAIAKTSKTLVVKRVTSGTEVAMDRVVEGEWTCELKKNRMVRKRADARSCSSCRGGSPTSRSCPARSGIPSSPTPSCSCRSRPPTRPTRSG